MTIVAEHGIGKKALERLIGMLTGRTRGAWLVVVLASALGAGSFCSSCSSFERRRATVEECDHIFDRLVAVELAERGLHDPVLTDRRAQALRQKLEGERPACVGRPLGAGAMSCVEKALNAEEIVHGCLK